MESFNCNVYLLFKFNKRKTMMIKQKVLSSQQLVYQFGRIEAYKMYIISCVNFSTFSLLSGGKKEHFHFPYQIGQCKIMRMTNELCAHSRKTQRFILYWNLLVASTVSWTYLKNSVIHIYIYSSEPISTLKCIFTCMLEKKRFRFLSMLW